MAEKRRDKSDKSDDDVMHGRSFAGASYGANEEEQTRDRERAGTNAQMDEEGEMITDAEMEVREANSSEEGKRK
jgi:hypothetical protein